MPGPAVTSTPPSPRLSCRNCHTKAATPSEPPPLLSQIFSGFSSPSTQESLTEAHRGALEGKRGDEVERGGWLQSQEDPRGLGPADWVRSEDVLK